MPRIFDNIEQALSPALQETLDRSDRADFCVGYFNLRGWKQLRSYIEKWAGGEGRCCRSMVGMQRLPQEELHEIVGLIKHNKEMDQPIAVRLRRKLATEFREQTAWGVPTDKDEVGLRRLAAQLRARKVARTVSRQNQSRILGGRIAPTLTQTPTSGTNSLGVNNVGVKNRHSPTLETRNICHNDQPSNDDEA